MMDPLTALSLAGNIIQFVDFGSRLLRRAGEFYKSSVGSLTVDDELELVTVDLQTLVVKLRKYLPPTESNNSQDIANQEDDESWASFKKVCDQAANIADEILGRLEKLKVKDGKHRKWRSLQKAVESLWSQKEIFSLMERLSGLRGALETRVLLSIRMKLDAENIRTSSYLGQHTQQIVSSILEAGAMSSNDISQKFHDGMTALTVTLTQLLSRLESMNHDNHRRTREMILERIHMKDTGRVDEDEIVAGIEMLDVSNMAERQLRMAVELEVIQGLSYPSMTHRYEGITEAHPKTFEWALQISTDEQHPWSNLPEWLKAGDGVYWVSGKAGSGKSTLMKLLFDKRETRQYLSKWAGDTPLCIASFFFWNSGTKEQKSHLGCLRALLFQVLRQYPELSSVVLPKQWARAYTKAIRKESKVYEDPWSVKELVSALNTLIYQETVPLKICFLVDGLDEFEGDYEEIAMLFSANCPNAKACLSSRPWVIFEDLWGNCPNLKLQDLNQRDIEKYVSDKTSQNMAFQGLATKEPETARALVEEIVGTAEGVFIWVVLVVNSLLRGIRNRDELSDLWDRLRLFPKELEPLYNRLLDLIEPVYLPWVVKAFQLLRINYKIVNSGFEEWVSGRSGVKPLSTCTFLLAIGNIDNSIKQDKAKLRAKCEDTIVQLTARCAGFLEVSSLEGKGPNSRIQYFHRTARDFLETESCRSKLDMLPINTDFESLAALMTSCILVLENEPIMALISSNSSGPGMGGLVDHMAVDTMCYAYYTEAHAEKMGFRNALLDRFFSVMAKCDRKYFTKSQWVAWLLRIWGCETTLELTTRYCLRGYVAGRLRQPGSRKKLPDTMTKFLYELLRLHGQKSSFPLPTVGVVSMLLGWGANVNRSPTPNSDQTSIWENTLLYVTRNRFPDDPSIEKTTTEANGDKACQHRRIIEIMTILVQSGAAPEAAIPWSGGYSKLSAIEVVTRWLLPPFPLETAPLLRELERALDEQKLDEVLVAPPSPEPKAGNKRPIDSTRSTEGEEQTEDCDEKGEQKRKRYNS